MPPSLLPIFVKLANRPCLLVGAGASADLHTPALDEDLTSLLQIIAAEPSAPPHNEDPERRLAQ
jgi:hypothetical protein